MEVKIDSISGDEIGGVQAGIQESPPTADSVSPVRVWIDYLISNGLHLPRKNLNYQELVRMMEKLEDLC